MGTSFNKIAKRYKRALVTGGAGFIGSHIVEELVKMGIETISIDDYFAGKRENLVNLKDHDNFHEVKCDVTDLKELEKHFKDIDIVFHNAASKKTICMNDPRRDLEINATGTFNLLELSLKDGVDKFIHASTGSVYGEAQYFPQNENHPLNPTSYYGASKLCGEKYTKVFEHLYDLNTTVLRYFHVYGPKQESSDVGGVVSIFARRLINNQPIIIYGEGTQQRSFTYVKDVVNANLFVASLEETKGEVYNCASGISLTIQGLAEQMIDILHKKDVSIIYEDWMPGDIKIFDIDNTKLKNLGFVFQVPFDEGLAKTVKWALDYFNKRKK